MTSAAAPLPRRACDNHPQRAAIGVCVITGQSICGECSTRYEGVNYSKDGLRILHERRHAADRAGGAGGPLRTAAAWLSAPVLAYLVYASYEGSARLLAELLRWGE